MKISSVEFATALYVMDYVRSFDTVSYSTVFNAWAYGCSGGGFAANEVLFFERIVLDLETMGLISWNTKTATITAIESPRMG